MQAVDESQSIFDHRLLRFLELGFEKKRAEYFAHEGVDWHEAKDLVDAGCSHELAFRILRPLPLPYLATYRGASGGQVWEVKVTPPAD